MIRGARLVVTENCCHWRQFEDPERFNRLHLDFLRSPEGRDAAG